MYIHVFQSSVNPRLIYVLDILYTAFNHIPTLKNRFENTAIGPIEIEGYIFQEINHLSTKYIPVPNDLHDFELGCRDKLKSNGIVFLDPNLSIWDIN